MKTFVADVCSLYLAPSEAFAALLGRSPWLPLAGLLLLNAGFTAVWLHHVQPGAFIQARLVESGRAETIPADQREQIVEQQARLFPVFAWVNPLISIPFGALLVAALYLCVFRVAFGQAETFTLRESLGVVGWAFFAVTLVSLPITLLTLGLRGDWNLDPRLVVQANLAALFDADALAGPPQVLASSLDLFSLWLLWLLASGYSVALRRRFSSALWGVSGLWVVYVALKAALAMLF